MASGDVHRTWFPQMIAMLRAEWSKSLSVPEFIALSQRLDDELRRIRSERTPAIRVKNALATANPIRSSAAQLISSIEVDRILRSSVLSTSALSSSSLNLKSPSATFPRPPEEGRIRLPFRHTKPSVCGGHCVNWQAASTSCTSRPDCTGTSSPAMCWSPPRSAW